MTMELRNLIPIPATGLIIYQTDNDPGFYYNASDPGTPDWIRINAGAIVLSEIRDSDGGTRVKTDESDSIFMDTDGTRRMTVLPAGNVGIGLTEPSELLEVAGKVHAQDGFSAPQTSGDGVYVFKAGNPSTNFPSVTTSGFEVAGVEGNGFYAGRADLAGVYVNSAGDDGVTVINAGDDGVSVGSAVNAGVSVYEAGNPSTHTPSVTKSGFEVAGVEGNGFYAGRADLAGVYVNSAGDDGVTVINAVDDGVSVFTVGNNGLYVGLAHENGVCVDTVGTHGFNVSWAGNYGIYVDATGLSGFHVDSAGKDGFSVYKAGSPTTQTERFLLCNGFEVAGAEACGLYVGFAGMAGVRVDSTAGDGIVVVNAGLNGVYVGDAEINGVHVYQAGDNGLYVGNAADNGIHIDTASYGITVDTAKIDGVFVQNSGYDGFIVWDAGQDGVDVWYAANDGVYANTLDGAQEWGLYTPDKIYASNVTSKGNSTYAKNTGSFTLEAGDIVCIAGGLEENVLNGEGYPVVNIEKADNSNSQAVFGVVEYKVTVSEKIEEAPDGSSPEIRKRFKYADGNVYSGDYLSVIVFGQAEVKVNSNEPVSAGDALVADNGVARTVKTTEVNGITIAENTGLLGKALENSSGERKIRVFVTCK